MTTLATSETNASYLNDGVTGNPSEFKGKAVVAFIDLLGFSASVRANWESALARLKRIKAAAEATRESGIVAYTPGGKGPPPALHRARVHTISDSIVICAALPETGGINDLMSAVIIVSACIQQAWSVALTEGYTLRGAIELGDIYWNEFDTIGPAFLDVYELESKVAKQSRVIVGPALLENLCNRMPNNWMEYPPSRWFVRSEDSLIRLSLQNMSEGKKDLIVYVKNLMEKSGKKRLQIHRAS
jgi:hypothetical protein